MKRMTAIALACLAGAWAWGGVRPASGGIIAQYAVPASGDQLAPTIIAPGVSAGDFLTNPNNSNVAISPESVGYTTGSGGINPSGDAAYRVIPNNTSVNATDKTTSVTNGAFASITITPNPGNTLNLTSVSLNIARGGGSTPRGFTLRSSADNFAADLVQSTGAGGDVGSQRPTWTGVVADLSGAPFQNLSTPITFRLYTWAPATGNSLDTDDMTVNGTVVTAPEPAAMSLAGLGSLGLLARRRRATA